jgi:hypothetical protein
MNPLIKLNEYRCMPLHIPILSSARALLSRSIVYISSGSIALETTSAWTRCQSSLSSDHRHQSTHPKIRMSLPENHTVHSSSIPLRPTLKFALPPKPNFVAEIPDYDHHHVRNSDVEPQSQRTSTKRSWRDDDSYQSRSPPRRERDTYYPRSSTGSRRESDSYRARSPSPRRETDRYIPRSPTREKSDRYTPDRSPPRRAATDSYVPIDNSTPLRTWTDSYRPDKLVSRRDYSTSTSRSPEKRPRQLSPVKSRARSRSFSSQRDIQPSRERRVPFISEEKPVEAVSKERADPLETTRFVPTLVRARQVLTIQSESTETPHFPSTTRTTCQSRQIYKHPDWTTHTGPKSRISSPTRPSTRPTNPHWPKIREVFISILHSSISTFSTSTIPCPYSNPSGRYRIL